MRLVKIDGMEVIINMDRVETLDVHKLGDDRWSFYVNGKNQGQFDSTYEKNRVMEMIYEKYGTPGEKLHIDERGYEVKKDELWE